eukprot:833_1
MQQEHSTNISYSRLIESKADQNNEEIKINMQRFGLTIPTATPKTSATFGSQLPDDQQIQPRNHYPYYNINNKKKSLLLHYIRWMLTSILLLICVIILSPILLLIMVWPMHFRQIYRVIGNHIFIAIIAMILPTLYLINYIFQLTSFHIDAFYTIVPLILSILFRDAVIFNARFKNAGEDQQQNHVCDRNVTWMNVALDTFLDHYQNNHRTINDYKPFGECKKHITIYTAGQKLEKYDFKWKTAMRMLSILASIIPMIYYVVHDLVVIQIQLSSSSIFFDLQHDEIGVGTFMLLLFATILGMIFLYFVAKDINKSIQHLFYQLHKYYLYMRQLTVMIQISTDESPSMLQTYHSDWRQNWCEIERIGASHFQQCTESILFALFTSLSGCVVCLFRYFLLNDIINTLTISIIGYFVYLCVVLIRLLMYAHKFSSLEAIQIGFITEQQEYCSQLVEQKVIKFDNLNMDKINVILEYQKADIIQKKLQRLINMISTRSLSPKITGIALNDALVKLAKSSFITIVSGAMAYLLKDISEHY